MSQDTPMLKQYKQIKRRVPDAILFFRLGDFYEMFYDDAQLAASVLDITLTSRPSGKAGRIPMAGVPFHAASQYIARLLSASHKVAICEQVGADDTGALMRRQVVRVYTPGTLVEDGLLDESANNYLAACCMVEDRWGVAVADLSTGEFLATEVPDQRSAAQELSMYGVAELIVPASDINTWPCTNAAVSRVDDQTFDREQTYAVVCRLLGTDDVREWGLQTRPAATAAAGALIYYAEQMQCGDVSQLTRLRLYEVGMHMQLDRATMRNLELIERASDGSAIGSLLSVLDQAVTPMGRRLLRKWLQQPLIDAEQICARHDQVEQMVTEPAARSSLRSVLQKIRDMERLAARTVTASANARDLAALGRSLRLIPQTAAATDRLSACSHITRCLTNNYPAQLADQLAAAVVDDPPATITEGGMIRPGFDPELDRLRDTADNGQRWLLEYEAQQRELSSIRSLKVGYNKVFGYYIEVTRANLSHVPDSYIRKQTLANAERFVTPELKQQEAAIITAREQANAVEQEILRRLKTQVQDHIAFIQAAAGAVAEIDVLAALAETAVLRDFVRPVMTCERVINIKDGRHPVLEEHLATGEFVPNDCYLDHNAYFALVTGPNMAGKSTYLRQCALICLLAQTGSFVPATSATLGLVDRIFTRIGAGDDLSRGHSTFMVEMMEVSTILTYATERSLIILDEVGRGTSTFDGLSIAWAVSEHIADQLRSRTLFASHYHELTRLERELPGVINLSIAVRERGDDIVFLRRVVRGGSDRSYGIEVARLAGLPETIIDRSRQLLSQLETDSTHQIAVASDDGLSQPSLFVTAPHPIIDRIRALNLVEITPIEALNLLFTWQRELAEGSDE